MKAKKLLSIFLSMAMLLSLFVVPVSAETAAPTEKWTAVAAATFGGGNGTVNSPYQIATAEQLAKLAVDVNSGVDGQTHSTEYFILTADIDLAGKLWTPIGTGTTEGSYHSFEGHFDGNNKTISNMYVDESATGSSAGLFGNMYAKGIDYVQNEVDYVVKDLTIENATVITAGGDTTSAGILAGYASVAWPVNEIKIINCHVSGTVTTTGRAGGLIGDANFIVAEGCSADAAVTGGGWTGGFVGYMFYPEVSNCTAKGTVNGKWSTGGFAGAITNQLNADTAGVKNCISYADVTASDWNAGGFAGYVGGTDIEKCVAYGDVTSTVTGWLPKLGGFAGSLEPCIGYREGDSSETYYASLTNCYYAGTLTSAHPSILPSGIAAVVTDGTITSSAYDGEKNPDIKGYDGEAASTALSTLETGSAICENVFGDHDMEDNTCTVCGYTEYSITLGSVQVTNVNAADILGDGKASYDAENNTLTLNGCTAYGDDQSLSALVAYGDLTIVLEGENYLYGVDGNTGMTAGIEAKGNLTIKGTGILNAIGGDNSGLTSAGIDVHNGDLVIEGGCTVNTTAQSAATYSIGISNETGKITINSSTVKAVAGSVTDGPSWGIEASSIEFKEATVTASGNNLAVKPSPELDYTNGYSWKKASGDELSTSEIDWGTDNIVDYLYIEPIAAVAKKTISTEIPLTAPASNAAPQTEIKTDEYTATVIWSPEVTDKFAYSTAYTATITIIPKANYTVTGIPENGYTVDGAQTVTNEADSETVTVAYAQTGRRPSSGGGTARYTVKFESNGGSAVASKTVTRNSTISEPTAPTKDGYSFIGWFTDEELTTAYDFDTKVTKGFTLYAKWAKHDDETPVEFEPSFTDVKTDDWFYEDVKYAVENGLFNGTTDTTFTPDGIITRAMMVTVLYRAEGEPEVTGTATFEDVDTNAYYAKAVVWGQQNGIIKGYSETEFAPDENIIREQIAAIMHRYAKVKGYDVSVGENTNILSYDDYSSISEYAVISMQYAVGSGILRGKTDTTLNPQDNATRAEIAAILHRFIEANK